MEQQNEYKTLRITQKSPNSRIFKVIINRPYRGNALSRAFFDELPAALTAVDVNPNAAVVVLSGAGNHFCSGIDLQTFVSLTEETADTGRAAEKLRRGIRSLQRALTAIEECRKPVIAAVHGGCIGGGVDLIAACDLRYCTEDAFFSVKEVDLGITADLGTLQRLPGIVGFGRAMELALTGRRFLAKEAREVGLVSGVFGDKEALEVGVEEIARGIAAKPPLSVIGTKRVLIQGRDMTLDQGLEYVATLNSGALLSKDVTEAISSQLQKRKPSFSKL